MRRKAKGQPDRAARAALKKLKKRFKEWRQTRRTPGPIPLDLLNAAKELVGPYRPGPLAKKLRLHYRRLLETPGGTPRPKRVEGLLPARRVPTFVKVPVELPRPMAPVGLEGPGVVEFESPQGYKARVFLGQAPTNLVSDLLKAISGENR